MLMKHALRAAWKLHSCQKQFPLNSKVAQRPNQSLTVALGRIWLEAYCVVGMGQLADPYWPLQMNIQVFFSLRSFSLSVDMMALKLFSFCQDVNCSERKKKPCQIFMPCPFPPRTDDTDGNMSKDWIFNWHTCSQAPIHFTCAMKAGWLTRPLVLHQ